MKTILLLIMLEFKIKSGGVGRFSSVYTTILVLYTKRDVDLK